ncbi:8-amino-7-oxononanoate synthase [Ferriphaselus sp. R-1]|uniref:8-amino-7-oxononanoate synthase n=1 Tax=Ferriphaselus sp. R-1 TaxID=1485544 RepID=UPI00055597C6|nr:8-amino-7-oxononanoate synthase [Ferriphaselus sp. R-1]
MPYAELHRDLGERSARGLRRQRRVQDSPSGTHVSIDGRHFLSFCSNDYLGLANDRRLTASLQQGVAQWGAGAGASHMVSGHLLPHHQLEAALAEFVGKPEALLFSTGYLANLGAVQALVGRNDEVFADKLNHASLNDAMLLSRAKVRRYRHNDIAQLASLLEHSVSKRKLVITDAVFSMDGDLAPLAELLALCERHDAWLLVDDAHGFGVLGDEGRGALSHFGLASPRLIYMATLGKAAGVSGAFVAAEAVVIDTLVNQARSYIYTTASPPALAVTVLEGLGILRSEHWRREQLHRLIAQLREGLADLRWSLLPSSTPIQPLLVGDNQSAVELSERLRARGILVPAIRPPTVPQGTARLRISLSAAHTGADVNQLIEALHELAH